MEEGELFSGVDGEGGVRSREAELLPLLPQHQWKQFPHLRTLLCRTGRVLKHHTKRWPRKRSRPSSFVWSNAVKKEAELQFYFQEKVLQSISKSAVSNEEVHLQFTWQFCRSEVLFRRNH